MEIMLDRSVYDAKQRRERIQGQDLQELDKAILKVAKYREQFPRSIDTSETNDSYSPQVKAYAARIEEQKEIDAFLHDFTSNRLH